MKNKIDDLKCKNIGVNCFQMTFKWPCECQPPYYMSSFVEVHVIDDISAIKLEKNSWHHT